jgi:hypothetical protein
MELLGSTVSVRLLRRDMVTDGDGAANVIMDEHLDLSAIIR